MDTKTLPIVKKRVKALDEQTEFESRRFVMIVCDPIVPNGGRKI